MIRSQELASRVVESVPSMLLMSLNHQKRARTYTPAEGKVCVSARTAGQEVEVRVQDTGMGIEAEHLPYLFKHFYRADPSRARATGGSGLGLAIVEQLVQAHGGHVAVESGGRVVMVRETTIRFLSAIDTSLTGAEQTEKVKKSGLCLLTLIKPSECDSYSSFSILIVVGCTVTTQRPSWSG
jgi:signal transduction histidine kinase